MTQTFPFSGGRRQWTDNESGFCNGPFFTVNQDDDDNSEDTGIYLGGKTTSKTAFKRIGGESYVRVSHGNDTYEILATSSGVYGVASSDLTFTLDRTNEYANRIITLAFGSNQLVGFRANDGVLQYKNALGDWTSLPTESIPFAVSSATAGQVLINNGTNWVNRTISGDATISETGLLTITNFSGLTESIDDRVVALIQDSTGITWTYNDGAGTLTPALDATLIALAGVTTSADKLIYATGSDTFSTTDLTSFGRSLIDDSDASTARTTLGTIAKAGDTMTGDLILQNSDLTTSQFILRSQNTAIVADDVLGGIDFETHDTNVTGTPALAARIQAVARGTQATNSYSTRLAFGARGNSAYTDVLFVTGTTQGSTRVGVGINDPSALFHVQDSSSGTIMILESTNVANSVAPFVVRHSKIGGAPGIAFDAWDAGGSTYVQVARVQGSMDTTTVGAVDGSLEFRVAIDGTMTTVAYLTSDKRLGINDNTPDATLDMACAVSTDVGLIIRGATSQSANLTRWDNASNQTMSLVASDGSFVLNELGSDVDVLRIEGDTATHLVYTDAGLDAFQIGTTTAGVIADFRSATIVFNEDGADRDIRFESDTDANNFFSDGGANCVGIGTGSPTAKLDVNSDIFRLRTAKTPASAAAAGNAGDFCWDSSYLYICIASNTWRRVAHATW